MKLKLQLIFLFFGFLSLNAEDLRLQMDQLYKDISTYKIIDVRPTDEYQKGHIKNALTFPIELTYNDKSVNGRLTEPNKMQETLRKQGLDVNDQVVIYDDGTFFDAARLFWGLEVYGFKHVKLLNGGFEEWSDLDLPISKENTETKESAYIASVDNKKLATKFSTQIATKSPFMLIMDARSYNAYIGEESNAKRFGHIPEAISRPAIHNISSSNNFSKLKDIKELEELYKDVDKSKKIISYCDVGKSSSSNYFSLRELGYDVANYDASWKEWGNDSELPIVTISKK
ncbi:MAG: rhodanese-like domain-containing protein [Aliarcobacter sp.]|nr:rhodanese-like domain-containing protein [Aliarcobacter sp.]